MDFEAILNQPLRWPQPGDQLFQVSPHWDGNACVADHPHSRMVMMVSGYKRAADLMVEQATRHRPDRETLVFPILFNYRQFLELSLKYLISTYGVTVDVDPIWDSHDLTKLWVRFAEVLDGYGTDPAVDTKGRPIALAHDHLDLAALADVMSGVDAYFTGCDGWLDSLQSAGA